MSKLPSILAALTLGAALGAQSYVTSPPGFLSTASTGLGSYSITFGAYFDERSQIADGNYRGSAFSISEIALRRDERTPSASNAIGKTWANFKLKVGDCDVAKLTNDWNKNFTGTPTMVMSGSLNWPTATQQSSSAPEPWGDLLPTKGGCTTSGGKTVCTALLFPFSKPYLYSGTNDLLWDFEFMGGTLNNNQAWGNYNKSYYLDGTSNRATVGGGVSTPTPYRDPIMTSCANTGSTRVGYAYARVVTYAVHNDPNLPKGSSDSFEVSWVVRDTKSVTGLIAISPFGTNNIGIAPSVFIGGKNAKGEANIGCMPLGIDMTKPMFPLVGVTTGTAFTYEVLPRQYIKYNAAYAGLQPIYGQFAFTDSKGAFRLTGTGRSLVFDQPTLQPWKSYVIGDYGSGNRGPQPRSGTGPAPTQNSVPLLRYKR